MQLASRWPPAKGLICSKKKTRQSFLVPAKKTTLGPLRSRGPLHCKILQRLLTPTLVINTQSIWLKCSTTKYCYSIWKFPRNAKIKELGESFFAFLCIFTYCPPTSNGNSGFSFEFSLFFCYFKHCEKPFFFYWYEFHLGLVIYTYY